jgi:hypothetical protein
MSCTAGRVPTVGEPAPEVPDRQAERAYQDLAARYSARGEIYDRLDTRLFAGATYQSEPFVEARVRRSGLFLSQPESVIAAELEKERAAMATAHEFFLGVHVNDPKYDDFDRPDSTWRLALAADGVEVTPIEVRRVGRSDLRLKAMYPYMDTFWVGYVVRFPRSLPPGARQAVLKVASALGRIELPIPLE